MTQLTETQTPDVDTVERGIEEAVKDSRLEREIVLPITKSYVLDTSVLIADPRALFKFAEHEVVIPIVVITELEKKRNDPELGYFARQALRHLDELRVKHGGLSKALPVNTERGTLRVELNHIDQAVLPAGFRTADNDSRILAVAKNLADEDKELAVTVVSKDLPMRVKASAMGLAADEYRNELVKGSGWTGFSTIFTTDKIVNEIRSGNPQSVDEVDELPINTGLVLKVSGTSNSVMGRVGADGHVHFVNGDLEAYGLSGRSAEQRLALDLLLDPKVGIVSLGGRAGTGKSTLALAAALELAMERRQHRKIVIFRPLYAVGGQELGYLPGSADEKMGPWAEAVQDALGDLVSPNAMEEIKGRGLIEVLPLTHIRGRTLHDAFVIVDEAQSLEKNVLLTVLSRMGRNSKVVLTHDVAQRDNLRVGRHDGVAAVVETLKGQPLFGHLELTRAERSPIAALVTSLLDES
ncbi:PhoH family protein (plasmid) [Citricoccus nitrophenolicus]